jgi:hypothetical protein
VFVLLQLGELHGYDLTELPIFRQDREPWLYRIRTNALEMLLPPSITSEQPIRSGKQPHTMVVACSALKRKYRDMLRGSLDLENETTKSTADLPNVNVDFIYREPFGLSSLAAPRFEKTVLTPNSQLSKKS